MRRFAAILLFCLYPGMGNAAQEESLRIYSDICWNVEGGDALGLRIGLIRLNEGTYAFVQWSVGAPEEKPDMTKVSAEDLNNGKLVFSVLVDEKPAIFRGTLTDKMLSGTFSPARPGDPKVFRLRRVPPRYRLPDCV